MCYNLECDIPVSVNATSQPTRGTSAIILKWEVVTTSTAAFISGMNLSVTCG